MATTSVADLQPDVDVAQASRHLELLHQGAEGYVSLVLLGDDRRERHCFIPTKDLTNVTDGEVITASVTELQDIVNQRWNLYTACSVFNTPPERGRGTRTDVLSVPGVWADLDVKPGVEGYFQSESELLAFTTRFPLKPTLEVASGSGGRHLYWLLHPDQRLDPNPGQSLLTAWLDYLRVMARGHVIENVHDTTRILRLAGTVRWPKSKGGDSTPMPRRVTLVREGPRYHYGEIHDACWPAFQEANELRKQLRAEREDLERNRRMSLEQRGLALPKYDQIVWLFNAMEDWARILIPLGWQLFSDERDGAARCRYWTRPGKSISDGKSASTDFVNDDGTTTRVMVIYTNDPAVYDLWENQDSTEAHGITTKWHAALKLYERDEGRLIRDVVTHNGQLP